MADNKDDSIVDLTEEENEGGGKQKAAKQKKPPAKKPDKKTPAEKKAPDEKKNAGKKSKKGGVILVLLLIIVVGGFLFEEIQFNMLGTRDVFIAAVAKLDPEYKTYEKKYAELDVSRAELDKREESLNSRQAQLDKLQSELELREETVNEREISLTPIYRLPLSGQELEDMQSLSKTYSQMEPTAAAGILASLYDKQDIAAILYHMSERSAASVLAAMDVQLAAQITEILLYK